mmetsp:Transcript_81380/g.226653  ORF Transcript_81380/g.226653 Transcript_81380/m.226653 type:complete len:283 (-) Transcript_81380:2124-2972(-)
MCRGPSRLGGPGPLRRGRTPRGRPQVPAAIEKDVGTHLLIRNPRGRNLGDGGIVEVVPLPVGAGPRVCDVVTAPKAADVDRHSQQVVQERRALLVFEAVPAEVQTLERIDHASVKPFPAVLRVRESLQLQNQHWWNRPKLHLFEGLAGLLATVAVPRVHRRKFVGLCEHLEASLQRDGARGLGAAGAAAAAPIVVRELQQGLRKIHTLLPFDDKEEARFGFQRPLLRIHLGLALGDAPLVFRAEQPPVVVWNGWPKMLRKLCPHCLDEFTPSAILPHASEQG